MEQTLTASEVCKAACCPASTLRAWRNRNGLFEGQHAIGEGWTRFDLAEAIGVRLVVILTQRGFATQPAINLVNNMRPLLVHACHGAAWWVGVGRAEDGETLEYRELTETGTILDNLNWFHGSVVTAIHLGAVAEEVLFSIQGQRGLDQTEDR
jgi:hypothetical protein